MQGADNALFIETCYCNKNLNLSSLCNFKPWKFRVERIALSGSDAV